MSLTMVAIGHDLHGADVTTTARVKVGTHL